MLKPQAILSILLCICIGIITFAVVSAIENSKKHDFREKCFMCHMDIPKEGASFEEISFSNTPEGMCSNCHDNVGKTSHPVGMMPSATIPLQRYLDKNGELTCLTCHDVHKERRKAFNAGDTSGFLRGHAKGRAFCFTCHGKNFLQAGWRHDVVVDTAHLSGDYIENVGETSFLDKTSMECLGCHDDGMAKMGLMIANSGNFAHDSGGSHPVGVKYPKFSPKNEFVPIQSLPKEIRLFKGKLGCLTCHNPYNKRKGRLVMSNYRSTLCLSCHAK